MGLFVSWIQADSRDITCSNPTVRDLPNSWQREKDMTAPYFCTSTGARALMELHPDLRDEPFMNTNRKTRNIAASTPKRIRPITVCITVGLTTVFAWAALGYYLETIKL